GVDLHRHAGGCASLKYLFKVVRIGLAAQEQPTTGMPQHIKVRIGNSPQQARRGFFAALIETRMNASDDNVELGEHGIIQVEAAVGEDIHFNAGQNAKSRVRNLKLGLDAANAGQVLEHALFVEPVGHGQRLGVVGDGNVLIAAGSGRGGHFLNGGLAVAGDRVHVEVATDI